MKTKLFVISALILVSIITYVGDGPCQIPPPLFYPPTVSVIDTKGHPKLGSGTFLALGLASDNMVGAMNGLKKITAVNTDTDIDDNTYEFPLTPSTYNFIFEWGSAEEFTGQSGTYRFTIEKSSGTITLETLPLPEGLVPLPIPENLQVSFQTGIATPTLSFDPVSKDVDFDFYQIRVFDKDYTRRIYSTRIPKNGNPMVIFRQSPFYSQTGEDLVPGERYLFKADIYKLIQGSNLIQSMNFKSFKVPKKVHGKQE